MAVFPKPHAVSPAAITCRRVVTSTIMSQRNAMSRHPSTPSAKSAPGRSPLSSASSWISFPPVDSIASMSAPACAHRSKLRIMCSHSSPVRISGGRTKSRMSLGVTRNALTSPRLARWASRRSLRIAVISAPHSGSRVSSGSSSSSSTSPGTPRAAAREHASSAICRYSSRISGMVASVIAIGGRVKFSSG